MCLLILHAIHVGGGGDDYDDKFKFHKKILNYWGMVITKFLQKMDSSYGTLIMTTTYEPGVEELFLHK